MLAHKDTFLTDDEIVTLSGRHTKSAQIRALRMMGIPFWINALGKAVIARAAIEGHASGAPAKAPDAEWVPDVLRRDHHG